MAVSDHNLHNCFFQRNHSRILARQYLTERCSNHRRNLVPTLKHTSRTVRRSQVALSQEPVRLTPTKVVCNKSAMPEFSALRMSEVGSYLPALLMETLSNSQLYR